MSEPEQVAAQTAGEASATPATPKEFPCRQCGAKLAFDPAAAAQKCPYCGFENSIPKSDADIKELDYAAALSQLAAQKDTCERLVVKCSSCAAESTLEPNITSAVCPFCGSNIVATGASRSILKPQSVLPFKVSRPQAHEYFGRWIAALWFAPNDLKEFARTEDRLAGVYVPYWTYDSNTTSFYTGERGDDYWTTEHYTVRVGNRTESRTRQVRRTRWRSVSGTVWEKFDDVIVLASRSLPQKYAEALEPWDLEHLLPYSDDYLAGFRAESYQVDLAQGFGRAKEIMYEGICAAVRRDIGGDHQRISSVKTQYDNVTFKHLLLPVWMTAYRYRKKVFRVLVNARTGEVQGERPWSWVKIALLTLGIIGAIGLVVFFAAARH